MPIARLLRAEYFGTTRDEVAVRNTMHFHLSTGSGAPSHDDASDLLGGLVSSGNYADWSGIFDTSGGARRLTVRTEPATGETGADQIEVTEYLEPGGGANGEYDLPPAATRIASLYSDTPTRRARGRLWLPPSQRQA